MTVFLEQPLASPVSAKNTFCCRIGGHDKEYLVKLKNKKFKLKKILNQPKKAKKENTTKKTNHGGN